MKNAIRVGLVLASALLIPSSALAASAKTATAHKAAAKICMTCPVTGAKIKSIKDAAGHSTYKGVTYYFCCSGCKPLFDKDPAKYVAAMKAKEHAK